MWLGVTQGHRQHNHSIERIRLPIRVGDPNVPITNQIWRTEICHDDVY